MECDLGFHRVQLLVAQNPGDVGLVLLFYFEVVAFEVRGTHDFAVVGVIFERAKLLLWLGIWFSQLAEILK